MTRPVMSFGHKHNDTIRVSASTGTWSFPMYAAYDSVNGIITTVIFIVSGQRELTLLFLRQERSQTKCMLANILYNIVLFQMRF